MLVHELARIAAIPAVGAQARKRRVTVVFRRDAGRGGRGAPGRHPYRPCRAGCCARGTAPERYDAELDAWWAGRKAGRREARDDD